MAEYKAASALREHMLEGHPVTLIKDLAHGDRTIADLRIKMIVAEGVLKACKESMKNAAGAIDTYRSMLTWLREEMHRT